MKQYKRILAILLAGAMTFSLAACGSNEKTESNSNEDKVAIDDDGYIVKATNADAKSKDNDLVIAIEGTISSMDPANIPDTNAISATRGCYESLVKFDENQQVVGLLAEDFEVSEDSMVYTFHLREGVKFHDGTDFNAAAVKANYDRVLDKNNNLRMRRTYVKTESDGTEIFRVASVETPDDYTVVFTLSEPWSPFLNRLTQFAIISPAALEQYGNNIMNNPVGTGPFVCTEWSEGDQTSFERFDGYWGEQPGVDTVVIKEVPEAGTRTAMLQTGEADFVYPTASDHIQAIQEADDVNIMATDSNIFRYVTLNANLPELSDVRVRQAMDYAIDKDAYNTLMYSGYGKEATSCVPDSIPGYEEQEAYAYNIEKAKELLKEAGYEDGFSLTLWGDNITQEIKGMTFVKQQLEQIGIQVEVVPMEPATLTDKIYVEPEETELNMWYVNWSASDFTMDGSLRSILYSQMAPPVSANTAYYNNEEVDALLDAGLKTANLEEQAEIYSKAQQQIWEDAPWLFLGNDCIIYSQKAYLSGVTISPDGAFDFTKATLEQ